ncbi:MAG: DUF1272 domain-containing protein [Gemmatimonadota bacterium]
MRTRCETCGAGIDHQALAFICSFECTFCPACSIAIAMACPNCSGELVRRPRRDAKPDPSAVG